MLTQGRTNYRPILYPEAEQYFEKQHLSHWLWHKFGMAADLDNFKNDLTDSERNLITNILKLFTQTEIEVQKEYWSKVARWFPHPEIAWMAGAFSDFESIHVKSYSYLNDSLNLPDSVYTDFLTDPVLSARINNLVELRDMPTSLAVFSAFTEGVALFSSFAILLNFSRFNLMKSLGKIITASAKDESLHSEGGCWLFRQYIKENPHIWTDDFKATIYQAARDVVALEDAFIDQAFEMGPVRGLTAEEVKIDIRHRANNRLKLLGLKSNWKNLKPSTLDWFAVLIASNQMQDNFANQNTQYNKTSIDFSDIVF